MALNQVKALLDIYESFNGDFLQDNIKPFVQQAVSEYLFQNDNTILTPFELELLPSSSKCTIIKMVRRRTGLSIADASALVENFIPKS